MSVAIVTKYFSRLCFYQKYSNLAKYFFPRQNRLLRDNNVGQIESLKFFSFAKVCYYQMSRIDVLLYYCTENFKNIIHAKRLLI